MKYTLTLTAALFALLVIASPSWAEMRTVSATGEHRMQANDSRADARRLAFHDAKRRAFEEAGKSMAGLPELQGLQLTPDELAAYMMGLIDVTELVTRTTSEGDTTLVRVDVTVRLDPQVLARQVTALHQSESVRAELLSLKEEADRLRQTLSTKTAELASRKSKGEAQPLIENRQGLMTKVEANGFVVQACAALGEMEYGTSVSGKPTPENRVHAKSLLDRALSLDPANAKAHGLMGTVLFFDKDFDEALHEYRAALRLDPTDPKGHLGAAAVLTQRGNVEGAMKELQSALQHQPKNAMAHYNLGVALHRRGNAKGAAQEYREFLRLIRNTQVNQPLINAARSSLQEVERQPSRGCATTAQAGTSSSTSDVGSFDFSVLLVPLIALAVYVIRFHRRQRQHGLASHSLPPS
jgi:tetratricopeptide (TPR) repeat protein